MKIETRIAVATSRGKTPYLALSANENGTDVRFLYDNDAIDYLTKALDEDYYLSDIFWFDFETGSQILSDHKMPQSDIDHLRQLVKDPRVKYHEFTGVDLGPNFSLYLQGMDIDLIEPLELAEIAFNTSIVYDGIIQHFYNSNDQDDDELY
jgi:CheY-like chemotaxis protein